MDEHFEIYPIANEIDFTNQLEKCFEFPSKPAFSPIKKRDHFNYFLNYLYKEKNGLHAQTILVENKYTSTSYLGDYLNYFVNCYKQYSKECRRIHFFSIKISRKKFLEMVLEEKDEHKKLWDSYLGYIVMKPLPNCVIGATLLKHYSDKDEKRFYTVKRKYPVNLFGKSLEIESLPFQEQDGIVGKCASSALWCAFQQTSHLFKSPTLHPSDITIMAGPDFYHTGKNFPNSGLEVEQICHAIQANGLISEVQDLRIKDINFLKAFIYAYLRMGVPVLLGLDIAVKGQHLVTLSGYKVSENIITQKSYVQINLYSNKIEKLYAHDDQTGPFSRFEFYKNGKYTLRTSVWKSEKVLGANILNAIAPLINTISVPFESILTQATIVSKILDKHFVVGLRKEMKIIIDWDIYLVESNKYKEEIKKELSQSAKLNSSINSILFTSLPIHIWVIKAYHRGALLFDMLFDAIDTVDFTPFAVNIYNLSYREQLVKLNLMEINRIFKLS